MPLVEVTFDPERVTGEALDRLCSVLLDAVAEGVGCDEEPWTGPPGPGDIEVRFHERHPRDLGELAIVIEVRSKRLASRVVDAQARADLMCERLRAAIAPVPLGVWLILHEGAWSQSA